MVVSLRRGEGLCWGRAGGWGGWMADYFFKELDLGLGLGGIRT